MKMRESVSDFKNLTSEPTGKRPLGRPKRKWEDNIRTNLKEIGVKTRNLIDSIKGRNYWRAFLNMVLTLRVLYAMELVIRFTQNSRTRYIKISREDIKPVPEIRA